MPNNQQGEKGFAAFLKKKDILFSANRYLIDALGAMALGLFASLLIGTIVDTVGNLTSSEMIIQLGSFAKTATGPAMAISIGYALRAPQLVLFTLTGVGVAANSLGGAGGPLAVLFAAVVATECGKLVSKETKVDILVTPLVTLVAGGLFSIWAAPAIGRAASAVGMFIMWATQMQPFFMGILVSVIVGVALTLPISSAAICAALGLVGLAGGAATAGCCAQMVGFAVMSFRVNRWGGLMAQGLGTSMLQMPNIIKNPRIWIPPTLASAITGPLATVMFRMEQNGPPIASGMGTAGLVGQIGVATGWITPSEAALSMGATPLVPGVMDWGALLLICFILPALFTWLIAIPCRKAGWFGDEDLRLQL